MVKKLLLLLVAICLFAVVSANIPCEKENRAHVAASSVLINLSQDRAWQKLGDLTLAHYYVPGLVKTQITTDKQRGLGTSRRVYQSEKRYINETVTAWHEGQGFTLKLHKDDGQAPFPFRDASFTYTIAPASEKQVTMSTSLHYRIGMGYLGHWLHRWIFAPIIQNRINQGASNLKHFYETDEPAGQ